MIDERIEPRAQSKRHFIESTDPAEVNARVDELFREYPADGYGTYIVSNDIDAVSGTYRAVVWHANSCD